MVPPTLSLHPKSAMATGEDAAAMPTPTGDSEELQEETQEDTTTMAEMMRMMRIMLKTYDDKIKELQEIIEGKKNQIGAPASDKLGPVNVKDIKMPKEYDHDVDEFTEWYERFKALLSLRWSTDAVSE